MLGVNKIILLGWMGLDPALSYTAAQKAIVRFRLATHRYSYDQEGNKTQHVDWHTVICHERLAEYCAHKLRKGSKVYVEGMLEYHVRKHHEHKTVSIQEAVVVAKQLHAIEGVVESDYPEDFPELAGRPAKKTPVSKRESSKASQLKKDLFE